MKKIVIIGNSASGISAAKSIRKKDSSSFVTIISQDKYPPYLKPKLLDYLAGDIKKEELFYIEDDFYAKNKIELIAQKQVVRINEKRKVIFLDDKANLDYDVLLLASGALSHIPEIKGTHKYGIFEIRSLDDIEKILELLPIISDVCIIGAGSIGLRAAVSFKKRNRDVTIITKSNFALSSYIDETASKIIQKRLEDYGIRFIFSQDIIELIGEGEVRAIKLESGKVIAGSLVLIAKGSRPNFNFIKDTDIEIDKGIVINERFETNIPGIYAAGEVCQSYNFILERPDINHNWQSALRQGEITGENITGNPIKYEGFLNIKSLDLLGLGVLSIGDINSDKLLEEKIFFDEKNGIYKKFIIKNNNVIGAMLIGDLSRKDELVDFIRNKKDISLLKI